ncbi:hypothetical protein BBAD15_g11507 [Beauveria bassiana D1-5]|uniref:BTB domain-containing protein n=1 Tax=Beauveria bassiana D1-5 TaxID=1245745 RepID=A0A0A2V704_BEABA|nr:hypothetical protein BBAD15_g11507 [Beauveria bassiana D1-5]
MHTSMTVLDPIGDLIVVIQDPNDQELLAGIVLSPHNDQGSGAGIVPGPSKGKKKTNAAERRRMRRRGLPQDQKPDTMPTDSAIVHEGGPSSPRLEESVNTFQGLTLAYNEDQTDFAKDYATPSLNADGSNEQHSLGPLEPEKDDEQNAAWFRISSSHLRLASDQVRRRLSSAYRGTVKDQLSLEDGTTCDVLRTEQWDRNTYLIFLNIVHGHNRQVPNSVSIDTLGKLAVLVDYYECHERFEMFATRWIEAMKGDLPKAYGETTILWLAISLVFEEKDIFKKMTEMVLKHSRSSFQADTLPLPQQLIGIKSRRRKTAGNQEITWIG